MSNFHDGLISNFMFIGCTNYSGGADGLLLHCLSLGLLFEFVRVVVQNTEDATVAEHEADPDLGTVDATRTPSNRSSTAGLSTSPGATIRSSPMAHARTSAGVHHNERSTSLVSPGHDAYTNDGQAHHPVMPTTSLAGICHLLSL
jgi:hypothetical protein